MSVVATDGAVFAVSDTESQDLAGTRLVIPPNSLAQDTTITLALGDAAIVDTGDEAAGPVAVHYLFPEAPLGVAIVGGAIFGGYCALNAVPQKFL